MDGDRTATETTETPPTEAFVPVVLDVLANRLDAFGKYVPGGAMTAKEPLSEEVVRAHVEGRAVIGIHAIGTDGMSRWAGWDFDNHSELPLVAEKNERVAKAAWGRLREMGAEPILEDSDGQGGYHLLVIFDEPVPAADVHRWAKAVVPEAGECFPKQPRVEPGGYGNWLRLPGRHPKRNHWSRVWDGASWIPWPDCLTFFTDARRCPASLVPSEGPEARQRDADGASSKPPEGGGPRRDHARGTEEIDRYLARRRIDAIHLLLQLAEWRADKYDSWIAVGLALHQIDDTALMLAVWTVWSQLSQKFKDGECAEKWRTFKEKTPGADLESLRRWAVEDARAASSGDLPGRIARLNALLSSGELQIRIKRIVRRGKVGGHVDVEMEDGTRVTLGSLADVASFPKVRNALLEAAGVVLSSKLKKDWDGVAQMIVACVEEEEGETDNDEIVELLETVLMAPPPLDADNEEDRERLVSDPHIPAFTRDGRLHIRLAALFKRLKTSGLWRHDRKDLGHRLRLAGWKRYRGSVGSRGERIRGTIYIAPEGWGDAE